MESLRRKMAPGNLIFWLQNPRSGRAGGFCLLLMFMMMLLSSPGEAQIIQVKYILHETGINAQFWARGRLIGTMPRVADQDTFEIRVNNWARRLDDILSNPPAPGDIKAGYISGRAVITRAGSVIFTFDYREAEAQGLTSIALARQWNDNLQYLLKNAPFISLKEKVVVVPLGESVTVPFEGRFDGLMEVFDYDPSVVEITVDHQGKKIHLRGLVLGKGAFRLSAPQAEFTGYYQVRMRSGHVPPELTLEVTGNPATPDFIQQAFRTHLYYRSGPSPGAVLVTGPPADKGEFKALNPGQTLDLTIPVRLEGEEYIPSARNLRLRVVNRGYSRPLPELLLVSNRPEVITAEGDLFREQIPGRTSARYFYHHCNFKGDPFRWFQLELKNTGTSPVTAYVSPVGTGPTPDEIFAGHLAASAYFDYLHQGLGWFVSIKPGTSYILDSRQLKPEQTISGVGHVSIIDGPGLELATTASLPGISAPSVQVPMPVAEEGRDHPRTSRGIFPAFIKMTPVHTIGRQYTFIYLGGEPYQSDLKNGLPNYGNYGAFYEIDLDITNPHDQERHARVYMVPRGGVARGIIKVDGTVLETPLMSPAQRVLLKHVTVPAGASQKVSLVTMPQGGSYYPVKIVVESEFVREITEVP